jgi:hypothetical protein
LRVFADHPADETAIKELASAGFDLKKLSVVGKGYHSDEKIMGFYNAGDRIKFWGTRGAFWGGFWGLFFGGLFLTVPVVGQVFVLGYLTTIAITAIEGALVVGGVNALGAALYSIGIPKGQRAAIRDHGEGRRLSGHGSRPCHGNRTRQNDPGHGQSLADRRASRRGNCATRRRRGWLNSSVIQA